jgi:hypothetical protein
MIKIRVSRTALQTPHCLIWIIWGLVRHVYSMRSRPMATQINASPPQIWQKYRAVFFAMEFALSETQTLALVDIYREGVTTGDVARLKPRFEPLDTLRR